MLARYLASFLLTLGIVCGLLTGLPFAARARVRGGAVVEETWTHRFTMGDGAGHWYPINNVARAELERKITFRGTGVVQVRSAVVQVTPKTVTWSRNKTNYSAPGGEMVTHITWSTAVDAHGGAAGDIGMMFPILDDMPKLKPVFRSGPYQFMPNGRRVFREVNAYGNDAAVTLARMAFALCAGLPITMLLHSIFWGLRLKRMRKAQVAAFDAEPWRPDQPRTFPPGDTAEWVDVTMAVAIIGGIGSLIALLAIHDGYLSTSVNRFLVGLALFGWLVALITGTIMRRRVVTVRLDADGIALARGRGEPRWVEARWPDLRGAAARSRTYRGNVTRWLEIITPDSRVWKVPSTSIGYQTLGDEVLRRYAGHGVRRE